MKDRVLRLGVFFGLALFFSEFTKGSFSPEQNTDLWNALPAFGVFILFVMAIFSLGALIRKAVKLPFFSGAENGFFDLTAGTTTLYVLAYLLTPLGLFSSNLRIFLWVILGFFYTFGAPLVRAQDWFLFAERRWIKFVLVIPLLIVFLKLIEGIQFPLHGDAYVVYLPAPRSWAAKGNFSDFLKFSQFFLATSFESLFAWGTALMGLTGSAGLDLTQFFAQWCTGGIAVFGIILGALSLAQRLALIFAVESIWFPIIAVSAAQVPVLRWTSNLAKNDTGVAFFGVGAFYLSFYLASLSPSLAFIAGAVTGAAVMGKVTLSLLGICIGLSVLIHSPKRTFPFAIGGLLGVAPVVLRNYFLTKNPVFPWYENIFPTGLLSPTFLQGSQDATHTSLSLESFCFYLKELRGELPLWFALVLVLAIAKDRIKVLKAIWVPSLAIFLFTCTFRSSTEVRYQNASLVIMAVFACYFSFYLLGKLPKNVKLAASSVFAMIVVATSSITTFTLFQIGSKKFTPLSLKLPTFTGGEGKLWIRQNLPRDSKILDIGDPDIYYLIDYPITELFQNIEWDTKMGLQEISTFERTLQTSSFDYLFLANDLSFYDRLSEVKQIMIDSAKWDVSCKRFANDKAQVWDVNCLRKKLKTQEQATKTAGL